MYQTGTHGSVGGRLANQSSASYPIGKGKEEARLKNASKYDSIPLVQGGIPCDQRPISKKN